MAVVRSAGIRDQDGAKLVLALLAESFLPRLELIWADGAYFRGGLVEWVRAFAGWLLCIVVREKGQRGFVVLPRRRWVVDGRSGGWGATDA